MKHTEVGGFFSTLMDEEKLKSLGTTQWELNVSRTCTWYEQEQNYYDENYLELVT